MHRLLQPKPHAVIDYLLVALLFIAPSIWDFTGAPRTLCYLFGVVQLGMSLLTAYPGGVLKKIPFTVHGAMEAIVAPVLVLLPFLFGFHDEQLAARNFFIAAGLAVAIVYLTTNYHAAELPRDRTSRAIPVGSSRNGMFDDRDRVNP